MQGPFEIEVKVHIELGSNNGVVTYSMPAGTYPTRDSVEKAVAAALKGAKDQLGDEVRLLGREEFTNVLIAERTGCNEQFACNDEWEK